MKYSSEHPPLKCIMSNSTWLKSVGVVTIRGVLIHSTGCNNPYVSRYVQPDDDAKDRDELIKVLGKNRNNNDWNHIYHEAGVHAWIGKMTDGSVRAIQTGPWNVKAWGCGPGKRGSCNNGWIQFEICEDALDDAAYFNAVYKEAVELTAYLCKLYNLNPEGVVKYKGVVVPVILCHQDSYQLGLGSNHADVLHWFPRFGKSMTNFRDDVSSLIKDDKPPIPSVPEPENVSVPFRFHVKREGLIIHSDPCPTDMLLKGIEPGVFTIVETRGNWGKLKSGAGWVWLGDGTKGVKLNA